MALKTMGYMTFTLACLAGAAVLGFRGVGDLSSTSATAPSTAPAATPPPPVAAAPLPVIPPAIASEVFATALERLSPPRALAGDPFPDLAQPHMVPMKRKPSAADRPRTTPAEIRTTPIVRPFPRPNLPPRSLAAAVPLVMSDAANAPAVPSLPAGPRMSEATAETPLPLLRLRLVTAPHYEQAPSRIAPTLTETGGAAMPLLPPSRTTPAPVLPAAEPQINGEGYRFTMPHTDTDAPASARPMPPRPLK